MLSVSRSSNITALLFLIFLCLQAHLFAENWDFPGRGKYTVQGEARSDASRFFLGYQYELCISVAVDPAGGSDACSSGLIVGTYPVVIGRDYRVYFGTFDWMYEFQDNYEQVEGQSARANEIAFSQFLRRTFKSPKSTVCAKIRHRDDSKSIRPGSLDPLLPGEMSKLHGNLISAKPYFEFEVRKGKVRVLWKKACCNENSECVGEVTVGRDECPEGTRTTNPGTTCGACQSMPKLPPEEVEKVPCCVDGQCTTKYTAKDCGMLGERLPGAKSCEGLDNPCAALTGACVLTQAKCREGLTSQQCYQLDQYARFLRGQPCPPEKGGCCSPIGACSLVEERNCRTDIGDRFYPDGCPEKCPIPLGACTLPCPNKYGIRCIDGTVLDCAKEDNATFTPNQACSTDPVVLKCAPPECYECKDLARDDLWPVLDGDLFLKIEGDQCRAELTDVQGHRHSGRWECKDPCLVDKTKGGVDLGGFCERTKNPRKVKITWNGTNQTFLLQEVWDGIDHFLKPIEEPILVGKFPCSSSELSAKPDGRFRKPSIGSFVVKGKYLCPTSRGFYMEKDGSQYTAYIRDGRTGWYEYGFRVIMQDRGREKDNEFRMTEYESGWSVDDNTGKRKTEYKISYYVD